MPIDRSKNFTSDMSSILVDSNSCLLIARSIFICFRQIRFYFALFYILGDGDQSDIDDGNFD